MVLDPTGPSASGGPGSSNGARGDCLAPLTSCGHLPLARIRCQCPGVLLARLGHRRSRLGIEDGHRQGEPCDRSVLRGLVRETRFRSMVRSHVAAATAKWFESEKSAVFIFLLEPARTLSESRDTRARRERPLAATGGLSRFFTSRSNIALPRWRSEGSERSKGILVRRASFPATAGWMPPPVRRRFPRAFRWFFSVHSRGGIGSNAGRFARPCQIPRHGGVPLRSS